MIAIFNTEAEAIAYSEKIHTYLSENCPKYNASKWQDPIEGVDGKFSVKQPIEETTHEWGDTETETELTDAAITKPLPDSGTITIDEYYLYKGDIVRCRQTHERTIYEPKDTPALFAFFGKIQSLYSG